MGISWEVRATSEGREENQLSTLRRWVRRRTEKTSCRFFSACLRTSAPQRRSQPVRHGLPAAGASISYTVSSPMSITRRHFFFGSLALPAFAAKVPPPRPNVLLFLVDNLPAWMLGCYGNKEVHAPN